MDSGATWPHEAHLELDAGESGGLGEIREQDVDRCGVGQRRDEATVDDTLFLDQLRTRGQNDPGSLRVAIDQSGAEEFVCGGASETRLEAAEGHSVGEFEDAPYRSVHAWGERRRSVANAREITGEIGAVCAV